MTITTAELAKTHDAIEKLLGKGSFHRGSESERAYRLPARSANINRATEGGFPIGRWTLLYGGESTFKTRVAFEAMAVAQNLVEETERLLLPQIKFYRELGNAKMVERLTEELEFIKAKWPDGMECVYYNAEQQWEREYAAKLGIDVDRVYIAESVTIEDIVSAMELLYRPYHMHVVDSTSNCTSLEEQGMKMSDYRIGLDARIWKKTLRKSMKFFNRPNGVDNPPEDHNIGILISQISTNVRSGAEQKAVGKYVGHTSSMTLHFRRGKYLYTVDGVMTDGKPGGADEASLAGRAEPDGVEIFAEVEKSRVCRPFRVAALHSDLNRRRFDHSWELANAAMHYGIARLSGSWYSILDNEGEVLNKAQGWKGLVKLIEADEDLQGLLYARLMDEVADDVLKQVAVSEPTQFDEDEEDPEEDLEAAEEVETVAAIS